MIDQERVRVVRKAILESENYSFDRYCLEHDLYKKGKELKAGGVWIACPFHGDVSPSLSFNEEKGIWHCFGCGAGGMLPEFMYQYETKVLQRELSKGAYFNELLRNDSSLQSAVGFSSLIKEDKLSIDGLTLLEKHKFCVRGGEPSLCELQEKFLRKKPDVSEVKFFISLMQSGLSAREIEQALNGKSVSSAKIDFSTEEFKD